MPDDIRTLRVTKEAHKAAKDAADAEGKKLYYMVSKDLLELYAPSKTKARKAGK